MSTGSAPRQWLWQTHLGIAAAAATEYHQFVHPHFLDLLQRAPRQVLDVCCAAGAVGAALKQRFAAARVIGIELNHAAAQLARAHLDQVFEQRFEDIDFAAAGFAVSDFDTIVLADVLEHMYNPWQFLVDLRSALDPQAQLLVSLPNTRHLGLGMALLDRGEWQYQDRGLLDITHLRFFTARSITELFVQTGFRIERMVANPDPHLLPLFEQAKAGHAATIRMGRLSLDGLSQQEIGELCTWQYFIRAGLAN